MISDKFAIILSHYIFEGTTKCNKCTEKLRMYYSGTEFRGY